VQGLRKRVIPGDDGFWDVEDKPFPMAMYQRQQEKKPKAKL
jgi:hypothetical protein